MLKTCLTIKTTVKPIAREFEIKFYLWNSAEPYCTKENELKLWNDWKL